jgi:hypothetical protein
MTVDSVKRKCISASGALFVGFKMLGADAQCLFGKCIITDRVIDELGLSHEDCRDYIYRWPSHFN